MSNDWQYLNVNGYPQPGSPATGGGGNPTTSTRADLVGFRSILDARRSMADGRTPSAAYPDGYLGTIKSRREDRLLQAVQSRLTQRSYQRGVHKGERVDPSDYYWTPEVYPEAALEAQAQGIKWTQSPGTPQEQINHLGKNHQVSPEVYDQVAAKTGVRTPPNLKSIDPIRRERLQRLLPSWR